jgi:hypothetical protein
MALLSGDRDRWLRMLAEVEEIGRSIQLPRAICSAWLERARVATIEGRLDAADQALRSAELHTDWAASDRYGHANDIDFPTRSAGDSRSRMASMNRPRQNWPMPSRLPPNASGTGALKPGFCWPWRSMARAGSPKRSSS